jgi:uncharacterized protein involved in outer membrane biogenesis
MALLGAMLVLALFLARPEANRLRSRLVNSISAALGRPVEVSSVTLQFLPRPGFGLTGFVVHDDASFGAEPIVRSQEVTAVLRVTSLLRGRLEIARLSLSEPSLNLARNSQGRWNIEELVERTVKSAVAPTGKARTELRPGFPYIEASDGRINFKLGEEKKSFALTDADFSLWQDSENSWGVRLKAQPMRTDFNSSDSGTLRVEGTWQRAQSLRETPLQFSAQWEGAQLGQFTRLFSGSDQGWRGAVLISLQMNGKPADLAIAGSASIEDFHRYDILGGGALRLAAQCQGRYSSIERQLSEIACRAPVGAGTMSVGGSMTGLLAPRVFDLSVALQDVPAAAVLALLRSAKKGIPDDLLLAGRMDSNIGLRREADTPTHWSGTGQISGLRLVSRSAAAEVSLDQVPVTIAQGDEGVPRMEIGPVHLPLGGSAPASVHSVLSPTGYRIQVQGEGTVKRLLLLGRLAGLHLAQPDAEGTAKADLQIGGVWAGFGSPALSGKAQLSGIRAAVRGVSSPLEIASATVSIHPTDVEVQNLTASLARSTWRGWLRWPRHCAGPSACPVQFDLRTRELAGDKLVQLFNPKPLERPWYRFLSSRPGKSYLSTVTATGRVGADRVLFHKLSVGHVSARLTLHDGQAELNDLAGDILGGKLDGNWHADFTSPTPQFAAIGSLQRVALAQIAEAMNDGWVSGNASASYEITAAGTTADSFLSSLKVRAEVRARDTSFPHLILAADAGALRAHSFSGEIAFRDGQLEVRQAILETANGSYQVSGTGSRGRNLNFRLLRAGTRGLIITGTLAEPHVSEGPAPATQAALKP